MNTLLTDHVAIKGAILAQSGSTGEYYSNWTPARSLFVAGVLNVGSITGTADLLIEQAQPSLTAVGITTTASAIATATTLAVSGGIYAVGDWVTADGVNFVKVTVAKTTAAAGNLTVTALPADVASGADVVAVTGVSTIASLSAGLTSGTTPWANAQTPALASAAGVYTLDIRGSDFNQNLPTLPTDGTGMGYNPTFYVRERVTLAVGSTSAVFSATLLGDTIYKPAFNDNAPGVVINRIQA